MSSKWMVTMFAVAACTSAARLFAVEVPAQAAPRTPLPLAPGDCDWTMQSNEIDINQDNGLVIHLSYDNTDTKGNASYTAKDGGPWGGPLTGGIVMGTNQLSFTADFRQTIHPGDGGPSTTEGITNRYTGTINPDGNGASGTTKNSAGVTNGWTTSAKFLCIGRAPAGLPPPWIRKVRSRLRRRDDRPGGEAADGSGPDVDHAGTTEHKGAHFEHRSNSRSLHVSRGRGQWPCGADRRTVRHRQNGHEGPDVPGAHAP